MVCSTTRISRALFEKGLALSCNSKIDQASPDIMASLEFHNLLIVCMVERFSHIHKIRHLSAEIARL
jgi:hypothetical protein